jgi:shikimate dehydrogenase
MPVSRPPSGAPWPTAATRPVVLLGWPARHSLSPTLHNAAFREQRLDLVYLAAPTPPERFTEVVAALGAVEAVGANVTVPHKQTAVTVCDHVTDEARLIGAVNTLTWTADGLLGDNTDATGLQDALTADVTVRPGDPLVVLGSGGAARAVAVAAGRLGCELTLLARRPDAAAPLATMATDAGARGAEVVATDDDAALTAAVHGARLVINATPLGMAGERLPEALHHLAADQVAYDLVYTPPVTPFLADAAARGVEHHHGLGMLIGQAAASYRRWTGRDAPVGTMSAAAISALRERARHA